MQKYRNINEWEKQNEYRFKHNKNQLSKALSSFSIGRMKYLADYFQEFDFPITIINGTEDDKFVKIGREMLNLNKKAKQYIIEESSHNVHLENSDIFLDVLMNRINGYDE